MSLQERVLLTAVLTKALVMLTMASLILGLGANAPSVDGPCAELLPTHTQLQRMCGFASGLLIVTALTTTQAVVQPIADWVISEHEVRLTLCGPRTTIFACCGPRTTKRWLHAAAASLRCLLLHVVPIPTTAPYSPLPFPLPHPILHAVTLPR